MIYFKRASTASNSLVLGLTKIIYLISKTFSLSKDLLASLNLKGNILALKAPPNYNSIAMTLPYSPSISTKRILIITRKFRV